MGQAIQLQVDAEAWRAEPGPILLLAGPGTGKTHQLALRVKHLVENKKVSPQAITVITFTKEAAENMRRRTSDEEKPDVYLPAESRPDRITTMHSLGLEIVRTHHQLLEIPDDFVVVADSKLRSALFRDASMLEGVGEREAADANRLRQECASLQPDSIAARVIRRYETILRTCHAIDYDDQITLACRLLSEHPEVRVEYAAAAEHLLVDEYQDINAGQRQLIELLSKDSRGGLFVVGDDDQSVYRFRGGDPKFIREFHIEFGDAGRVLCLVESRRCPDTVISAGLNILEAFDSSRVVKPVPTFSEKKQNGFKVQIHDVPSDDDEANIIARLAEKALPRKKILILVPAKQYAEKIKHALRRRKISYIHPPNLDESGFLVIQRAHHWILHPDHNLALRLCMEAVCESGTLDMPSRRARGKEKLEKRSACLRQIAGLWTQVIDRHVSLWAALAAAASSGDPFPQSLHNRLESLRSIGLDDVPNFMKVAAENLGPWRDRDELMEEIGAWVEELRAHSQQSEGGVRIMTLQAAKGLEADVVFVVGLNEGILPRAGIGDNDIAETARLTYVSMTRAISELHLFHARKRDASITYLQQSFALKPSRFLGAINQKHRETRFYQANSKRKKAS